jgi:hypothetical protein
MKFVLITKDSALVESAQKGFHPDDELRVYADWRVALENCADVDLMFVDLIATLLEPHKIEGYEQFALAKMKHPVAGPVKLALLSPPEDYELDFMAGFPDFIYLHYRHPIDYKIFRRASTWV